jgi:hypothetical protein
MIFDVDTRNNLAAKRRMRFIKEVWLDSDEPDSDETEANARRIVAAVNACAGIPTEHLEKGIISDLIKWRDFQTVLVRDNVILSQEDQRRAAIAFKAVEGIPTEALEAGVVGELMECLSRLAYEAERRAGVPGKYVANARELLTQASYYERRRKALAKAKGDADANQ